jgi:kynurenine formamidase
MAPTIDVDSQSSIPGPALGRIGPAQRLAALGLVREGRTVELGTTFGRDMPQGSNETFFGFRVSQYRTPKSLTTRQQPGFDFSMEVIQGSPHLGSHIDGLAHIQSEGRLYGDHEVVDVFTDWGWKVNGIETVAPIVGRGILLDVAAALGTPRLDERYEVTPMDLERTCHAQGSDIRLGDIVLVRTGHFAAFYDSDPDRYFRSQPGVGPEAAVWLYERGMAVLGTDTSGTEVVPFPDPDRTTHRAMIVERGVHLLEILDLERAAAEHQYEFCFICLPLRIVGATGSWIRPIAFV